MAWIVATPALSTGVPECFGMVTNQCKFTGRDDPPRRCFGTLANNDLGTCLIQHSIFYHKLFLRPIHVAESIPYSNINWF